MCDVGCCGEQVEVGGYFGEAAHSGSPSSVSSSREVGGFSFDTGPGGLVVVLPAAGFLAFAAFGENGFVFADSDGSAAGGVGALFSEVAVCASVTEAGAAGGLKR